MRIFNRFFTHLLHVPNCDKLYICPTKTEGMGLPNGENFMILSSTFFVCNTRVTDGRTKGRRGDSI